MMKRCGAKKKDGTPCQSWGMENGRCRIHGGKTPVGIASPQTKHGRYSKYLPARLAGKYEQSQNDPDLLALRDEVSIVDSRIAELLERIDTGESQSQWTLLQGLHAQLLTAMYAKDTARMSTAIKGMGEAIEAGAESGQAWADIFTAVEQRRRLVESERKRMVEQQQYVTAEQAMLLVSALIDVVTKHVRDRNTISAIYADVSKLTDKQGA